MYLRMDRWVFQHNTRAASRRRPSWRTVWVPCAVAYLRWVEHSGKDASEETGTGVAELRCFEGKSQRWVWVRFVWTTGKFPKVQKLGGAWRQFRWHKLQTRADLQGMDQSYHYHCAKYLRGFLIRDLLLEQRNIIGNWKESWDEVFSLRGSISNLRRHIFADDRGLPIAGPCSLAISY